MEARVLSGSTVETCPKCRGLWVEWFDGELIAVVKETAPLSLRPPVAIDPTKALCPGCTQPLTPEAHGGAVVLLRCADCAGCFVPREAFTALMELDLPAHAVGGNLEKHGAFARLIAAIRRVFHTEPTVKLGDARAHYDLAVAYHAKGLIAEALDEIEIVLELQPGDRDAKALWETLAGLKR
jgi:Zn-finger nucleic acid-binding protein